MINVTDVNTVLDVDVRLSITHTFDGDLDIFLDGPNGVQVELTTDNGSTGENFIEHGLRRRRGHVDHRGNRSVHGELQARDAAVGAQRHRRRTATWTLHVIDDAGVDVGTLDSFELILTYPAQPCGAFVQRQSSHLQPTRCGAGGVGDNDGVVDPGEQVAIPVTLVNTGTDPATNVTATLSADDARRDASWTGRRAIPTSPSGSASLGDAPFQIVVDASSRAAQSIDLGVTISTTQGTWNELVLVPDGDAGLRAGHVPLDGHPEADHGREHHELDDRGGRARAGR